MRRWPTWSRISPPLISNCGSGRMNYSSTRSSGPASSRFGSASMPLVEGGRIVEDRYLRVTDDAPIPDRVPVIVPGRRFLADAGELTRRDGSLGVAWPNDRRVAELARRLRFLRREEGRRCAGLRRGLGALQRGLSAGCRWPHRRAAAADTEAGRSPATAGWRTVTAGRPDSSLRGAERRSNPVLDCFASLTMTPLFLQ